MTINTEKTKALTLPKTFDTRSKLGYFNRFLKYWFFKQINMVRTILIYFSEAIKTTLSVAYMYFDVSLVKRSALMRFQCYILLNNWLCLNLGETGAQWLTKIYFSFYAILITANFGVIKYSVSCTHYSAYQHILLCVLSVKRALTRLLRTININLEFIKYFSCEFNSSLFSA